MIFHRPCLCETSSTDNLAISEQESERGTKTPKVEDEAHDNDGCACRGRGLARGGRERVRHALGRAGRPLAKRWAGAGTRISFPLSRYGGRGGA